MIDRIALDEMVETLRSMGVGFEPAVRALRREWVRQAYALAGWNQCELAERLGVHRNTVRHLLDALDIPARSPESIRLYRTAGLRPQRRVR